MGKNGNNFTTLILAIKAARFFSFCRRCVPRFFHSDLLSAFAIAIAIAIAATTDGNECNLLLLYSLYEYVRTVCNRPKRIHSLRIGVWN